MTQSERPSSSSQTVTEDPPPPEIPGAARAIADLLRAVRAAFAPPPKLKVSEWAEEYRYLSAEEGSEQGKWHNKPMPHLVELMDAPLEPGVEVTLALFPSQSGKTQAGLNFLGYSIHQDPCPVMIIGPTVEWVERYSRTRLAPMVRDTPVLRDRISDPRSRNSDNTLLSKTFPGGYVLLVGSNAPGTLAGPPIRRVLFEELDTMERSAGTEGDPFMLGYRRTVRFYNRQIFVVTTPRVRGLSRSEDLWKRSDQRYRMAPCPECGELQPLWFSLEYRPQEFKDPPDAGFLKWDTDDEGHPVNVRYVCAGCKAEIPEEKQAWMIAAGQWVPTRKLRRTAGFRMNALLSRYWTWSRIVEEFLESKGELQTLKVFVNTVLTEYWELLGEVLDPTSLMARKRAYPPNVWAPRGVLVITAGVDVQENRLELFVWGWGVGDEAWAIDKEIFYGDTSRDEVWDMLTPALSKTYLHEDGDQYRILSVCIDSGYNSQRVYRYCRGKTARRVFATKGSDTRGLPVVSSSHKKRTGKERRPVELFIIGTDDAKGIVTSRLKITEDGPGCFHYPDRPEFDAEFFAQLASEKPEIGKDRRGRRKRIWKQIRDRNEAFDGLILAFAALQLLNPAWKKLKKRADARWAEREVERLKAGADSQAGSQEPPETPPLPSSTTRPKGPPRRPRQSNWVTSWRRR